MASIEKITGGYRVVWRDGGRGSKKHHTPLIKRRDLAEAERERIEAEVAAAKPLRSYAILAIEEVIQRWIRSRLSGSRPNDEWSTRKAAGVVRAHCRRMGWGTVADITPAEVQRWRDTQKRTLRAGANLRAVLRWARDYAEQTVDSRTLVALRPPPDEGRPPKALPTTDAIAKAVEAAKGMSENAGWMVHCLTTYGWRAITAARALVGDLREDGLVVRTKGRRGHREQLVPLLPQTMDGLRRIAQDRPQSASLFIDPRTGRAWPEHGAGSIPQWCRDHLGLGSNELKFHAVTNLLDVLEPHQARALTTHKTLSQLYRYARENRERGQQTIAKLTEAGFGVPRHGTRRDTGRIPIARLRRRPPQNRRSIPSSGPHEPDRNEPSPT